MKAGMHDISQMLLIFLVIITLFISFVLLFVRINNKSYNRYITEKKLREKQFETELLQSQLEIQEKTLKNISQEIHDNIGQALTMAKLNLNTLPVTEEQRGKIDLTKEIISKVIGDLRDLSKSLNTDYISKLGLHNAIGYELQLIEKSTSIKTILQTEGEYAIIDKQTELILFRMVQEILNNTLKHADARTVSVEIGCDGKLMVLTVSDDGKGMNENGALPENATGLGLRNIYNRAQLIGAASTINSIPGQGTSIKISLPLKADSSNSLPGN